MKRYLWKGVLLLSAGTLLGLGLGGGCLSAAVQRILVAVNFD